LPFTRFFETWAKYPSTNRAPIEFNSHPRTGLKRADEVLGYEVIERLIECSNLREDSNAAERAAFWQGNSESERATKLVGLAGLFPGEFTFVSTKVSVRRRLLVDGTTKIKFLRDSGGTQVKEFSN